MRQQSKESTASLEHSPARTESAQVHTGANDFSLHSARQKRRQSENLYKDQPINKHKRGSRDYVQNDGRHGDRSALRTSMLGSFFGLKSVTNSSSSRTSKTNSSTAKQSSSVMPPRWANRMSFRPARIHDSNTTPSTGDSSGRPPRGGDTEMIERSWQYPYSSRHVVTEQARKLQSFLSKQSSKSL